MKPDWLKIRVKNSDAFQYVEEVLKKNCLNTVCQEANCPNRMECYNKKTATFMILGRNCTRNCRFCDVTPGEPEPVDRDEPLHVACAVRDLGLKHVVVTSVTRDDLPDGGAQHFTEVIAAVRKENPKVTIEVLIPDFQGDEEALLTVINAEPEIINHNVETVPRLYPDLRPQADYTRSVNLLRRVKQKAKGIRTKSGLMLGVGEKEEEVLLVMDDLRKADVDFLTIGQYLAPSSEHFPVKEYIEPAVFDRYKTIAYEKGFSAAASAPLVRSSYKAADMLEQNG